MLTKKGHPFNPFKRLGIALRRWRKRRTTPADRFYGDGLPYATVDDLTGQLIVIEGTDNVGRATQMERLAQWLKVEKYGVIITSEAESSLIGREIERAKRRNTLTPLTLSLLYALDLADRLENRIIPALKDGFIVLADRYIYTILARHTIRGIDPQWIRRLFGFAPIPDLVLYLDIDVSTLIPRAMKSEKGLNYWEAGMDLHLSENPYESFIEYQTCLLREFDQMKTEFGFITIDACQEIDAVYADLQASIRQFLTSQQTRQKEGHHAKHI